jgi:hypothetical protein
MKFPLFSRTVVVPLILLVACQTQTPPVIPAPTVTATIIPSPSPSPTATPDPEIISPENASQLVLKFMNMGTARSFPTFSSDGKWLYQKSTAGTYAFDTISYQDVHLLATTPTELLLPDAQTFSRLEALPGFMLHDQSIFSPDRSLIAGYSRSDLTTVWGLADGKIINQFDGRPNEISPDNRLITIGWSESYDTYTRYYVDLYDLQTGKQLGSWGSRRAFFLSDNRLVVESSDGYTRIFDPATRKVSHGFPGWYAAFSPDEQNVAVLHGNQIRVYQVSDGKLVRMFDSGLPSTDTATLLFNGDGEILAGLTTEYYCCAGLSSRLFLWQISDGHLLADLSRSETLGQWGKPPISLSPDGQTIVIGTRVIRVSDGSLIKDLGQYFIDAVDNIAFTTDGQKVIVLDVYGKVHLYAVDSGMPSVPQDADRETYLPLIQPASGISSDLSISNVGEAFHIPVSQLKCFTFSPDGQILALGLHDGSVELWDVDGKQKIHTLSPRTDVNSNHEVSGLAFSPDGKLLAVGMVDGTVRLFEMKANRQRSE